MPYCIVCTSTNYVQILVDIIICNVVMFLCETAGVCKLLCGCFFGAEKCAWSQNIIVRNYVFLMGNILVADYFSTIGLIYFKSAIYKEFVTTY